MTLEQITLTTTPEELAAAFKADATYWNETNMADAMHLILKLQKEK